jgi:transcriptional regulator with XRE-family HTH domain
MPKREQMVPRRIGRQIKYHRKRCGMSQQQLATEVGVVQSVVAGWEAEIKNPIIDKLPAIARALGVSEHELIANGAEPVRKGGDA